MTAQLAFDLPVREAVGREDFFVAPSNALALAALGGWRNWPGLKMVLVGPEGAGKTHLAHVWAAETGARVMHDLSTAADLAAVATTPVVIEDADTFAGTEAEEALFHLHNLMAAAQLPLLLTARTPPRDWGVRLPDLSSRMTAASVTRIDPPDDTLLSAILVKLFADRQITVPAALVPWLVSRMERSCAAARQTVCEIDTRALTEKRPVTRALAAQVLDSLGSG